MTQLSQNTMIQGRYLIVQMIGSGPTGEVYLAVDQWSGNAVTLKRTALGDSGDVKDAIERKSKSLLNLRHPVLPKVNDSFVEDGQHFLVMENISGADLGTRLQESKKPFPIGWCMFWADQLLDALTYMHSHTPAITHGDIKPANLKLTEENHIVLLDHGLGGGHKEAVPDPERKTSPYASPEEVRRTPIDPRSDLYSFAATFYQLMTNVVPPDARKRADAVRSGLPDPLVSLSKANPDVSADVSEVMEKALELLPEKRFAVAAEMQRALRRAFKRTQEGTTARTLEFRQTDQPTVEMQGQGAEHADVVTAAETAVISEIPTKTHIESSADGPAPTVQMPKSGEETDSTFSFDTASAKSEAHATDVTTETFSSGSVSSAITEIAPEPVLQTPVSRTTGVIGGEARSQVKVSPSVKKSSSKAGLAIGALVGFLILAGIVGGGVWYAYNNYYKAAIVVPSPSPVVSVSPTPETEMASGANINSNSDTVQVGNANSADNATNKATVASSTPAGKPAQNLPARTNPVRTSQPPNARPTIKPKSGDDRTVILQ